MTLRKILSSILLLSAALCAYAQKGKPFVFQPSWSAQAQFAGYYIAKEKGFYEEAGLDVDIVHPFATQSAEERVAAGDADAYALPLMEAMELRSKGHPLINIHQSSMNCSAMMISRFGDDPSKMKGAKVLVWRAGYAQIARCFSAIKGLDYNWVEAAASLNIFVSGAIDITLAKGFNEYYQILQSGLVKEDSEGIYRFAENGYNIQEDGVWMREDSYRKDPQSAKAFAEATKKGWEWVAANPNDALDIVMAYVRRFKLPSNRVLQKLMLEEVLSLQKDPDSGEREFRLRPDMVSEASALMKEGGIITEDITYEQIIP